MYPLKIFIIAGEVSGDLLGGAILRAMTGQTTRRLDVRGIGGDGIKSGGMRTSLFPMHELSVMGIAEIIPKIPHFLRRIRETVDAIEGFKPDLIITIDSPDFCFRVQQKLRLRGNLRGAKQIHVVAPSVWAWRPGRAEKISKFLDGLVCFFPFEPPYFEKYGLRSMSMGHPAINAPSATADPAQLRKTLDIKPDDITLGLYLGSRAGVVERHAPLFIAAVNMLAQTHKNIRVLIPTFPVLADRVRALTQDLGVRYHVVTDPVMKPMAMRACDVALAVSGTVGLELAIANVPHVVGYRASWLTALIVKRLIKPGQFAHLANIVLDRMVVPELIQDHCTPEELSKAMSRLMDDQAAAMLQQTAFATVRRAIGEGADVTPADKAAGFVLGMVEG